MSFLTVKQTLQTVCGQTLEAIDSTTGFLSCPSTEGAIDNTNEKVDQEITTVITPIGYTFFITHNTASPGSRPHSLNARQVLYHDAGPSSPLRTDAFLPNFLHDYQKYSATKMSGAASPDVSKMTVYACRGCKDNWMVPKEELKTGVVDGYNLTYWRIDNGVPSRCLNCIAVLGAIEKMRNLVVQNPWLETEGMAGEPKREAWELVGTETTAPVDSGVASHCSSNGDGRTREESEKFRAQMAEGFAKIADEGMTDEEALETKEGEEKMEKEEESEGKAAA